MRLPDADPTQSPELAAAFAEFLRTRGIVSNVMKSFAHAPAGLSAIVQLGSYCRYETALSELQKELTILITGRGVAYAWAHHAPLGRKTGLTERQLAALKDGKLPTGLSAADTALAAYVLEYGALKGVLDATFQALAAHFTPRQITDINITSGYYLMIASSIIGMQVVPDSTDVTHAGVAFQAARG
jgi:4-carboxymuconolactone decarboxylase